MLKFKDDYGNSAIIEQTKCYAYNGAKNKTDCYRLSIYADYDDNFLYYVSVFETLGDAKNGLSKLSCNTWKQFR